VTINTEEDYCAVSEL